MTAAPELTAFPTLTLTPLTPDVVSIPFHRTRRSPLNPRRTFDHAALVELAVSIYVRTPRDPLGRVIGTGILQNLMGRPDAQHEGDAEIAAGERRQRAVELLVNGLTAMVPDGVDANGRPVIKAQFMQVDCDYPMPFRVEEMTDAELIETATLENIQRQDMTAMEEADAYMALVSAGRSEDAIALKYGKHPATVRSRIQLAAGLGKEGRKLLDAGEITLEQARVIASTSGALKKNLTEQARYGATADSLKRMVRAGAFLLEHALFDVEASGLRIDEGGLLGDFPAKFADHKAALCAQVEALERVKQQEEQPGDGAPQWAEIHIVPIDGPFLHLDGGEWSWALPQGMTPGLALAYSTQTGQHKRIEGVARRSDVQSFYRQRDEEDEREAQAQRAAASHDEDGAATETAEAQPSGHTPFTPSPSISTPKIREAAHEIGHQTRCQAIDGHLATHPQLCLALACQSLIQNASHSYHRTLMGISTKGRREVPMTGEGQTLGAQLVERFPLLFSLDDAGRLTLNRGFDLDVLGVLTAESVTVDDLLSVFTYFTHRQVGEWDTHTARPAAHVTQFAAQIGADADLTERFTLSSEYLNAYATDGLHALIQTMPEKVQPVGKPGASKKEVVGLILEKAPSLKQAGWLPDLVKFK